MRKIKIVRIISRLNIGGPAIHAVLLSSSLNGDGYEDILISGKAGEHEGDMLYLAREKKVEPVMIPEMGREIAIGNDVKALFKICSILRREKPDIVHTHTAKAGALGRLAAIMAGVPIKVHTFHGHIFDGYFSPLRAKIFLIIERFLALFTDKVITVSGYIKDDIVNKLKVTASDKCVVIPLGLELDKFLNCDSKKGSFRRSFGINDSVLLVGMVGRLVPIKNHAMFLEAVKKLKDKFPEINVKFVIVGDGELKDKLKGIAKKEGLEQDALFTGWIEDLSSVYADLDIVILTSLNEGTPVSLIEAMAAGKPVIATDVGGVRDIVNDGACGFLVNSGDSSSLCDKMVSLLKDCEARKKYSEISRAHVMAKYTSRRLAEDIKNLYNELAESKRPAKG